MSSNKVFVVVNKFQSDRFLKMVVSILSTAFSSRPVDTPLFELKLLLPEDTEGTNEK